MARDLPPRSPFAGDDGSPDEHLHAALQRGDEHRLAAVVDALARARVLVPVVAHLDERAEPVEGAGGRQIAGEKRASAAMVTLATPDGRAAMPIFTGITALQAWRADARPIPVPGPQASLAAVTEADGVLVLDPGGPIPVLIPRPAVWAVAQGRPWRPPEDDDGLIEQIRDALSAVPGIRAVQLRAASNGATRIVLGVSPGLRRDQVERITAAAGAELAKCDVVAQRLDAIGFQVRAC